jgi:hypothetical protein
MLVNLVEDKEKKIASEQHKEPITQLEAMIKFKILSHFMKRKISLILMGTILIILKELKYLEGLVKLVRRRKDVEVHKNQVVNVHPTHAIRKVNVNKAHCTKHYIWWSKSIKH